MTKKRKRTTAILCSAFLLLQTMLAPNASVFSVDVEEEEPPLEVFQVVYDYNENGHMTEFYVDQNGNRTEHKISSGNGYGKANSDSIPSKYDLRDYGYVSDVRNQGQTQTCWAHATIGLVENNLIMQGLADRDTVNFSEAHLVWFSMGKATPEEPDDPVYQAAGKNLEACKIEDLEHEQRNCNCAYDNGGDLLLAAIALSRDNGVISESEDGIYSDSLSDKEKELVSLYGTVALKKKVGENLRYTSEAHLKEVYDLGNRPERDDIKYHIMHDGGITASYYDDVKGYRKGTFFNCLIDEELKTNHTILIIGWDDNYSKYNFEGPPVHNGAWLCKNSWGTDSPRMDDGYFYISYDEFTLSQFHGLSMESADKYDHIYQYDSEGSNTAGFSQHPISIANVYTAVDDCELTSVGFRTADPNEPYTIKVFTDCSENSPADGATRTTQTGIVNDKGYHNVSLDNKITLTPGQRFSVVVTMERPGALAYYDGGTTGTGRSFYKYGNPDANGWHDAGQEFNADMCLKAFTKKYIAIDEAHFPDPQLRNYIMNFIDGKNGSRDQHISLNEAAAVTDLNLANMGIESLKGIEVFENLNFLNCSNNRLTNLDVVQQLPKLEFLDCSYNQLYTLDVSACTKMKELHANNNTHTFYEETFCKNVTPPGVVPKRVKNIQNGKVENNQMTCDSNKVTYTYDCGQNQTVEFTALYNNFKHNCNYEKDDTNHWRINNGVVAEKAPHIFEDACDATCRECGYERYVPHFYDNDCDPECNKCGFIREARHTYNNNLFDKNRFNKSESMHRLVCDNCGTPSNVLNPHQFDSDCDTTCNDCGHTRIVNPHDHIVKQDNQQQHILECRICGDVKAAPHKLENPCGGYCKDCYTYVEYQHTFADTYDITKQGHYKDCTRCHEWIEPDTRGPHKFDNECDTTCNICGYEREAAHRFSSFYEKTEDVHWQKCGLCGLETEKEAHVYDNACDNQCNVCKKKRNVPGHNWSKGVYFDRDGHYHHCDRCDGKDYVAKHTFNIEWHQDKNATTRHCIICNVKVVKHDLNLDGNFNISDNVSLSRWLLGYKDVICYREEADFNGDGKVNALDLVLMKRAMLNNK